MSARVRAAVVGVGAFGRHHARIYSQLPEAELVAVVDANPAAREEAVKAYGCRAFADPSEVPADVEAVSVAVPTKFHHAVALPLLKRGVSVLIEKPMVRLLDEGRELIAAAEKSGAILQVGHVERFNPAVRALRDHKIVPRYIEAARVAPFPFRATDVGVVLDLMIHDIDIVLHLAGSPVRSVEAIGVPVLMSTEDICNARLTFENGCVASLTASRVATKSERKVRVFSADSYLVLDFGRREGFLYTKSAGLTPGKIQEFIGQAVAGGKATIADLQGKVFTDLLHMERLTIPEGDALTEEIKDFLRCVRDRAMPAVSGREGLAAVSVALDVLAAIGRSSG